MPKNPARYLTGKYAEVKHTRVDLPVGRLVEGCARVAGPTSTTRAPSCGWVTTTSSWSGVDDPHVGFDRYHAVSAPAADDVTLTMGLVHAPYQRVLDAMVADGASVVLAGHTHGGQLALPVWGALVTNCDLDTRRAKGVSRWWPGAGYTGHGGGAVPSSQAPQDAAWLHVSAGLGTSPYAPVRFACRPGGDPAHPRRPRRLTHGAAAAAGGRPGGLGPISAGRGGSAILGCRRALGLGGTATGCGAAW